MPLKVETDYDVSLDMNKQPLYDEEKLAAYAKAKGVAISALSEEEKRPFIVGYMSF